MKGSRRSWLIAGLAGFAVALTVGAFWMVNHWPFTRSAITRVLQKDLRGHVEIAKFRQTWFPPGCVADGISVNAAPGAEPLVTARNLIVQSSWHGLPFRSISKIKLIGLHIVIPAKGSVDSSIVHKSGSPPPFSSIGEIETNEAVLELASDKAGTPNRKLSLHQLVLAHLGAGQTVRFQASMLTDKPAGELDAQGEVGPWNSANPSAARVSGIYRLTSADLKTFQHLHGLVSSNGKFSGDFTRIDTSGTVDVPDLHVDGAARSVHLTAQYQAAVNAQTADTVLSNVEAHAGRTTILATGDITGAKGSDVKTNLKTAHLQMRVDSGRIEDLMNYFSAARRPSMTGAVKLRASVELPPGEGFLKRIRLTGDFGVDGAKFTNPQRQTSVNQLSESADGIEVKHDARDVEAEPTVVSNLRGHVVVKGGTARLSNVSFEFPGAFAQMAGTFELIPRTIDIRGTLRTTGAISDASTGFKALMLKVATPFMKKKNTTIVPFAITGNASHPSIGLDLRNKIKL